MTECEDEVICDFAETYNIYRYEDLPVDTVKVLVFGLRDNSRTKMKLSKQTLTHEQTLLSMVVDELRFQSWTYSKDAHKGKAYNSKSVLKALNGEYKEDKEDLMSFKTIEEFELYMAQYEVNNG